MSEHVEVRRGAYHDSVTLLQVSQEVASEPGVRAALVAMATELNLELAAGMGFTCPDAGPADLLIAVRSDEEAALGPALAAVDRALAAAGAYRAASAEAPPRSVRAAAERVPATLALVSVPGEHAFSEAMEALETGLHVMVFSDNVPVAEELALKDAAATRGLLVMGPDCGTAIVGGVGLGFANAVRRGRVGVVAASGTGAQQLSCLLDAAGVGISHLLGVGGRDLTEAVGGRATLTALAALAADPATEVIAVVSKPPAATVRQRVAEAAAEAGKPVVMALLGEGEEDLTAATEKLLAGAGSAVPAWPSWTPDDPRPPAPGALRGLFSGGTLCDEAMLIATAVLGPVRSNIPLRDEWALPPEAGLGGAGVPGHVMIDFGDDTLTAGRPHPMIDPSLRLERLAAEAADPATAVVLLDVVLGFGAHPDPASTLAPAITAARERAAADGRVLAIVVSLCGTEADPQSLGRQAAALRAAGAWVYLSNAAAARKAVALARGGTA